MGPCTADCPCRRRTRAASSTPSPSERRRCRLPWRSAAPPCPTRVSPMTRAAKPAEPATRKVREKDILSPSSPMDPSPPSMQDETPAGIAAGRRNPRLVRDLRVDQPMHVLHQPIDRETRGLLARRVFLVGLEILRDLCHPSILDVNVIDQPVPVCIGGNV